MQTIKHKGVKKVEANYCFICEKSYISIEKLNRHFRTKKHKQQSDIDDPIMAVDMLSEIENWLEYMRTELDNEQIDLAELSEIEQVYDVIKIDLEKK